MKCSVLNCKNPIRFRFPSNISVKKKWLKAIKRPNFEPTASHGICAQHFHPEDIITESFSGGYKLQNIQVKRGAVPTLFLNSNKIIVNTQSQAQSSKNDGAELKNNQIKEINEKNPKLVNSSQSHFLIESKSDNTLEKNECVLSSKSDDEEVASNNLICEASFNIREEVITESIDVKNNNLDEVNHQKNHLNEAKRSISCQTDRSPRYSIHDFEDNPKTLLHLTGLENYKKFMTVLYSLGPAVHNLKYERSTVGNLSIPNQLFLVLWKLRRYPCDIELAEHFNISQIAVGNIFITWIKFMSKTWSLIDLWPSRKLINFYIPNNFKKNYPNTRVIIDGTEIKVDASSNPKHKQSSFSTYKNTNTMKTLIGATPGGLISYFSPAYGGSTSDRQIVERSDLQMKCQPGDIVMGDKGFMVQDLFAPYSVTVATPTPLVSGSLSNKMVLKDRQLSKHRVQIERVIGLLKTFTIISKKLNHNYIPLASDIIGVCVMLTNFKESIISKDVF